MPNWCNNNLTLRHSDSKMIDRAYSAIYKGQFLNEFIPIPQSLRDTIAGYPPESEREAHEAQKLDNLANHGYKDWYEFCVAEWGTKWDVGGDDCSIRRVDDNTIEVSFTSAWAPPVDAYEKLIAIGFEIKAYYDEPGMAFCGKWEGSGTDFIDDYFEYGNESAETVRMFIGAELDDFWCISENMETNEV